jgi:octaprenyl-diphosphate synthase
VISQLGQALADGELKQLHNIESKKIDEASYYEVIRKKTASLFAASAQLGALLAGGTPENAERMRQFGQLVGICFQLRDDIFDYDDSQDVGKPTGNDLREGKLTLPLIYALRQSNNEQMLAKAYKVRAHEATTEEVTELVEFTKQQGGLEYATWAMDEFRMMASGLIDESKHPEVVNSLHLYVDFVAKRNI